MHEKKVKIVEKIEWFEAKIVQAAERACCL